jgi:hypothetical protein
MLNDFLRAVDAHAMQPADDPLWHIRQWYRVIERCETDEARRPSFYDARPDLHRRLYDQFLAEVQR